MTRGDDLPVPSTIGRTRSAAAVRTGWALSFAQDVAPRGELQGSALVGRNRPVVGAGVTILAEADPSLVALTSTDARGTFRVDGLPDGTYRVEVVRQGFAPVVTSAVSVRFPFRAVVEVLMRPADAPSAPAAIARSSGTGAFDVAGQVVERGAGPVPGVRLRLLRGDASADPRFVETDDAGRFVESDLPGGEWRVEAHGVGFLPIHARVDLSRDSNVKVVLVRQPADYEPTPLELMPPEAPVPPPGLLQPLVGPVPLPPAGVEAATPEAAPTNPDGESAASPAAPRVMGDESDR